MALETWQLDTTHSSIGFTVRHMVVAKVHGRFTNFDGKIQMNTDPAEGSVEVNIDASSIDTQVADRDNHLRSPDFFDTAKFPKLTFRSRRLVSAGGHRYRVIGDLTIRDVTREVELDTEFLGQLTDPWGNQRVAFTASTSINRKDFGLAWNKALETGGVLVGERVDIQLEVQAVKVASSEKAA